MQASTGSNLYLTGSMQEQIHEYLGGTFRADERVRRMGRDQDSPRTPTHRKACDPRPRHPLSTAHFPSAALVSKSQRLSRAGTTQKWPSQSARVSGSLAATHFNWRTGRGPGRVSRLSKVHRSFFPLPPRSFHCPLPLLTQFNSPCTVPSSSQPVLLVSPISTTNNLTFTLSTFTFLYRFDDLQTVLAKPFQTRLYHIVAANSNL